MNNPNAQGMGMIAGCLLLFVPEEETFWMMSSIIDQLLPASYFSSNLWGAQVSGYYIQTGMLPMGRMLGENQTYSPPHNSLHTY